MDIKYSLTPSLTLDGTYRTDFAQVEVDQQQVNLTRFNLFFPEKRDFFLENAGLFSFGNLGNNGNLVPFFSRRIGLNSAGTPIPIVGGARVTGKVKRLYDVGLIAMKTESSGTTPSNNFLVGRLKRNLWRNTYIGALVTAAIQPSPATTTAYTDPTHIFSSSTSCSLIRTSCGATPRANPTRMVPGVLRRHGEVTN